MGAATIVPPLHGLGQTIVLMPNKPSLFLRSHWTLIRVVARSTGGASRGGYCDSIRLRRTRRKASRNKRGTWLPFILDVSVTYSWLPTALSRSSPWAPAPMHC